MKIKSPLFSLEVEETFWYTMSTSSIVLVYKYYQVNSEQKLVQYSI